MESISMHPAFVARKTANSIPIWFATAATWRTIRDRLDDAACAFAEASGFEPKPGRHLILANAKGEVGGILFAIENANAPARDLFRAGGLPNVLPAGTYRFATPPHDARLAALAFVLGCYRFSRY